MREMDAVTMGRDAVYWLSHGGEASWLWDLPGGGVMLLLGLWFGYEMWGREPGLDGSGLRRWNWLADRGIAPQGRCLPEGVGLACLDCREAQDLQELAAVAKRDLALAESALHDALQARDQAMERLGRLEAQGRRLLEERGMVGAAVKLAEKQWREWERKAVLLHGAAERAARDVEESPSAVSALHAGEATSLDKEAAREVARAAAELQEARDRSLAVDWAVARWEREVAAARSAVEAAKVAAREGTEAAGTARTVAEVVGRALRKAGPARWGGRRGEATRSGVEGEPGSPPVQGPSKAARAAALLLGRDLDEGS